VVAPIVRLLGEVHLRDSAGGGRVDLGPHGRRLLAVLGLQRAQSVPSHRLALAMWGEQAEPGTTALRMAISRLRRRLEEAGLPDVLEARGGAYRLEVPPTAIDATQFLEVVRNARRLAEIRPEQAVTLLEEGLRLWEGEPLGTLGTESWAQADTARLAETRLEAEDLWATAQLALGRERLVLEDLQAAADAAPYRELRWVRLASALSRLGRQVDALRAIDRARRLLRHDLGLDPGPELRETERVLLTGTTPGLAAALPTDPPATALIGRSDELERLRHLLDQHRVVSVVGPGGVGKTALARAVSESVAAGGERVCEVWLDGRPGVHEVRLGIAERAGVVGTGADAGDLPSAIAARLQAYDLLVLDGAEAGAEAVAEVVDGLALLAPNVRVLITTREPIRALHEVRFDLLPLAVGTADSPGPAVELFFARADLDPAGLGRADLEEAVSICTRAGGLPLAVELSASGTARPEAVSEASTLEVGERALRRAFDSAIASLPDQGIRLLGRAARLPDGISLGAAAVLLDLPTTEIRALLGQLADLHLVDVSAVRVKGPRYAPPPPVRRDALERLPRGEEDDAAVLRFLADLAASAGDPLGIPALEAVPDVEEKLGNLRHWLERLVGTRTGFELAISMTTAWNQLGLAGEGADWLRRLHAALPEADEHDDLAVVTAVTQLGTMSADVHLEELRTAVETAERLGDWRRWFHLTGSLVLALARTGSLDDAMHLILSEEILDRVRAHGDEWVDLQRQEMIGLGPTAFGAPEMARDLTVGFPERYLALGDRAAAVRSHYYRGWAASLADDLDAARADLQAALDLAYDGLPRLTVALARAELALVGERSGDPTAHEVLRAAVDDLDRAGSSRMAAIHRRGLAQHHLRQGEHDDACALLKAALPILLRTDRRQAAAALADLALALEAQDPERSARLVGAALAVAGPTEHPMGEAPEVEAVRSVARRLPQEASRLVEAGRRLDDEGILEEALR
jgi:DNA-binding SARP family transcriptional activator/tetratricopeptide (TPR) repeat protein